MTINLLNIVMFRKPSYMVSTCMLIVLFMSIYSMKMNEGIVYRVTLETSKSGPDCINSTILYFHLTIEFFP